ncbi:E3 ubiquitin-protein ligase TRIM50-like [Daktulosphaira vitifoliae]|uniref:E3 ubiquitin-protein ligase TRIM50-like n=1 Tax=Daktulosphaira vitifoliae TaxID=58002 RepID=UPI0021AA4B05|nr:E3 ubiquitin-protein ligase TRIM50-like [Daktulosphaira vitifoliae]
MSIKSKIVLIVFIIVVTAQCGNFWKKFLSKLNNKIDVPRCLKCMAQEANTTLDFCSHKYCKNCVEEAFNHHMRFQCLTCRNNVDAASTIENVRIYKKCDNQNEHQITKLIPCNHIFCSECAFEMVVKNMCRDCKKNVTSFDTV